LPADRCVSGGRALSSVRKDQGLAAHPYPLRSMRIATPCMAPRATIASTAGDDGNILVENGGGNILIVSDWDDYANGGADDDFSSGRSTHGQRTCGAALPGPDPLRDGVNAPRCRTGGATCTAESRPGLRKGNRTRGSMAGGQRLRSGRRGVLPR
jgi:hypothetical protein